MVVTGFGHKPPELGGYNKDVFAKLVAFAVEILPQAKATKVISGMALGWEQALALATLELELPLVISIPFNGQEKVWPEKSQLLYHEILSGAAEIHTISNGGFQPTKYWECDTWMVDNAEKILVLWNHEAFPLQSGVTETEVDGDIEWLLTNPIKSAEILRRIVEYAEEKERRICQLWTQWQEWDKDVRFESFRDLMLSISLG